MKSLAIDESDSDTEDIKDFSSMVGSEVPKSLVLADKVANPLIIDERRALVRIFNPIDGSGTRRDVGYSVLVTNFGTLYFELFASLTPLASENFIKHCASGYYIGSTFLRIASGSWAQGGDPTNTRKGGTSIWGRQFRNEIHSDLRHNRRGLLSMANISSKKNSNSSQFFITFAPFPDFDGRYTLFGRLLDGFKALDDMESVPTGKEYKPLIDIIVTDSYAVYDPFDDPESSLYHINDKEMKSLLGRADDQGRVAAP